MQTIKQLLYDAVEYEESLLAHAVFIAVQDGLVTLDDPASMFDMDRLDKEKVIKANGENQLAISTVTLFAMPLEPGCFAFVLARTEEDAEAEYRRQYGYGPQKVLNMQDNMDRSIYFPEKNKHMSFRTIKGHVQSFPYFVCEFQSDKRKKAA